MPINVFDFFSGCGGTSRGFQDAGLIPVFALDFDKDATTTYAHNFSDAHVENRDITKFRTAALAPLIESTRDQPTLFCGCAPCQPFTRQNTTKPEKDRRVNLLNSFSRFVREYRPNYIFIENVPGFQKLKKNGPLNDFRSVLDDLGYFHKIKVVNAQDYGVPQMRRRLVLIASSVADVVFPTSTHGPKTDTPYSSVREWIADLPPLSAGEECSMMPNHRAARLSDLNLERIRAIPPEADRSCWPERLKLECHKNHKGHMDVYSRMKWDSPSSCLTTRCISLSNGRFGHPEQDRAISVREAACLQTFPREFEFFGSLNAQARQIGNAVPARLAEVFGRYFNEHWEQHQGN